TARFFDSSDAPGKVTRRSPVKSSDFSDRTLKPSIPGCRAANVAAGEVVRAATTGDSGSAGRADTDPVRRNGTTLAATSASPAARFGIMSSSSPGWQNHDLAGQRAGALQRIVFL